MKCDTARLAPYQYGPLLITVKIYIPILKKKEKTKTTKQKATLELFWSKLTRKANLNGNNINENDCTCE